MLIFLPALTVTLNVTQNQLQKSLILQNNYFEFPRIIGAYLSRRRGSPVIPEGDRARRRRDQYALQDNKYNRMSDGSRNERRVTYCSVRDPWCQWEERRTYGVTGVDRPVPVFSAGPPMGTFHTGNRREAPFIAPASPLVADAWCVVTLRSFGYAKSI